MSRNHRRSKNRDRLIYQAAVPSIAASWLIANRERRSVHSVGRMSQGEWITRYIVPPLVQNIMLQGGYAVDPIPQHQPGCSHANAKGKIQLVYPVNGIRIFVPRDLDGQYEKIVFSALHQQQDSYLFWYLNGNLIGETQKDHKLAVSLDQGSYRLTIQDEEGNRESVRFSAYRNKELAQM